MLLSFHFRLEVKVILVASTVICSCGLADDIWGVSLFSDSSSGCRRAPSRGVRDSCDIRPRLPGWYCHGNHHHHGVDYRYNEFMNFIDGHDGLASAAASSTPCSFSLIAILTKAILSDVPRACYHGKLRRVSSPTTSGKGKTRLVFLGDSGSTFLGFLLASFAILGEWGKSIVDIVIPVLS